MRKVFREKATSMSVSHSDVVRNNIETGIIEGDVKIPVPGQKTKTSISADLLVGYEYQNSYQRRKK